MTRWWRRLVGGLVACAGFELFFVLIEADPDPVRLALLVATCVGLLGLIVDAFADPASAWDEDDVQPPVRGAGDPGFATHVNLLEAHLSARVPDNAVRARLRALADRVLLQRYGVPTDDPRAEALLGPELSAVLRGPARRMDVAEIDRLLTRIEEL